MYYDILWYEEVWRGWLDMLKDWPVGSFVGVIVGLVVIGVALAIVTSIYRLLDQAFTRSQEGTGRVTKRWIRKGYMVSESYTEFRVQWVPPQPMVEVMLTEENVTGEFEVGQSEHDAACEQTPVRISFQRGRFSGNIYLNSYTTRA